MQSYYCPKCKVTLDNHDWDLDETVTSYSKNHVYQTYYQECPQCHTGLLLKLSYSLDEEYLEVE